MYCKHCGKQIADDAKFCDGCGKSVSESQTVVISDDEPKEKKRKRHPVAGTVLLVLSIFLIFSILISSDPVPEQPEISKGEYMQMCKEISYEDLARNPESHKGEYFKFTGEVIQVIENGKRADLRVNVTPNTVFNNTYYTDTIYVVLTLPDDGERVLTQDIITFYGICDGLYTYKTVLGSELSIPRINVAYWNVKK